MTAAAWFLFGASIVIAYGAWSHHRDAQALHRRTVAACESHYDAMAALGRAVTARHPSVVEEAETFLKGHNK